MNTNEPRGCLLAIFRVLGFGGRGGPKLQPLPYRLRDDFLSPAELSFFRVLQLALNGQATITCKVNLADIFFVTRPNENRGHRNRIDRKHVDFLLCDPQTMRPLVGIELDDSSHQRAIRIERDALVEQVFETAGLPLLRVPARAAYQPQQLAGDLACYLMPSQLHATQAIPPVTEGPPICPKCGVAMVRRIASHGPRSGQAFWGCTNFPRCRATC